MQQLKYTLLFFLLIIYWCCQNQTTTKMDDNLCTLVISHGECTGCRDFWIDSGDIKVADKVLAKFKPYTRPKKGLIQDTFKKPNLTDFIISDKTLFRKMWGTELTLNVFGDTMYFDFSKKYRVKGWVVDFDSKGNTYFKIKEYTLLDSVYAKQFDLEKIVF